MNKQQPEALRREYRATMPPEVLHLLELDVLACVASLEAQLEAVGAGGVGPLIACAGFSAADSVTAPAVNSRAYEMLRKAAGTALEVLQKHRQMKGDWPVGELGRRAAEELQAARDASFNADREDPAQLADSVQEDAAWMPLTHELLAAIESGDLGNRFWIAAHNNNEPQIGVYEWRQGRNPHGFNSDTGRYGAGEITHVLPYKPPALPAARNQGATK